MHKTRLFELQKRKNFWGGDTAQWGGDTSFPHPTPSAPRSSRLRRSKLAPSTLALSAFVLPAFPVSSPDLGVIAERLQTNTWGLDLNSSLWCGLCLVYCLKTTNIPLTRFERTL